MPPQRPPGPYRHILVDNVTTAPFYIIPFDKEGICEAPATRQRLIEDVTQTPYTDIYLFSHGWNNDWTTAVQSYQGFLDGFMQMRRQHNLPITGHYRPLLVGIFWPSTALVFTEAEVGPEMAAGDPAAIDHAVTIERQAIRELAEQLKSSQRARFYELLQQEKLNEQEALELAKITKVFYHVPDDELGADEKLKPQEIVELWRRAQPPIAAEDSEDFGIVDFGAEDFGAEDEDAGTPQAASWLNNLDPRNIVRMLTVYQMKDRAGKVGAFGVSPLLRALLDARDVKLHLIGHSFGGKVMLSAIAVGEPFAHQRKVESLLLLQPAVSHLCFANQVPKTNRAGGYRKVFERVRKPIVSTFTTQDLPLHQLFHLFLRRPGDLGEVQIAAPGEHPEPPSPYAALGGYGPRQSGESLLFIKAVNDPYVLNTGVPIYGVNGTDVITGHGEISNPATWWALYCLVAAGRS